MRIEFPLLSILAVSMLLLFTFTGGTPQLFSWETEFSISPREVCVSINPVFVVWVERDLIYSLGGNAMACGNVMVIDEEFRGFALDDPRPNPLRHEYNHVRQFFGLGWFFWPMKYVVNIEPPRGGSKADMYIPPENLFCRWRFISFKVDL